MDPNFQIADRLVDAFSGFDAEALAEVLAPDVEHWVNVTGQTRGRDAMLEQIRLEGSHIASSRFELRHRVATDEGFVLQLTISGETKGGAAFELPACLVVSVEHDQVIRIDEYVSSDHVEPIVQEIFGRN